MSRGARGLLTAAAIGLAGLALGGCASLMRHKPPPPPPPVAEAPPPAPPPRAEPAPVRAPPPQARVSCVPRTLAKPPRYPDGDAELRDAGGAADRYQLMAAGRLLRMQRLAELERIIEGCRQAGP